MSSVQKIASVFEQPHGQTVGPSLSLFSLILYHEQSLYGRRAPQQRCQHNVCVCVCVCACVCVCLQVCISVYLHACLRACVCVRVFACVLACVFAGICVSACVHACLQVCVSAIVPHMVSARVHMSDGPYDSAPSPSIMILFLPARRMVLFFGC